MNGLATLLVLAVAAVFSASANLMGNQTMMVEVTAMVDGKEEVVYKYMQELKWKQEGTYPTRAKTEYEGTQTTNGGESMELKGEEMIEEFVTTVAIDMEGMPKHVTTIVQRKKNLMNKMEIMEDTMAINSDEAPMMYSGSVDKVTDNRKAGDGEGMVQEKVQFFQENITESNTQNPREKMTMMSTSFSEAVMQPVSDNATTSFSQMNTTISQMMMDDDKMMEQKITMMIKSQTFMSTKDEMHKNMMETMTTISVDQHIDLGSETSAPLVLINSATTEHVANILSVAKASKVFSFGI